MENESVTLHVFTQEPVDYTGDLLVFPVEEDIAHLGDFGHTLNRLMQQVWETGDFKGGKGQVFVL